MPDITVTPAYGDKIVMSFHIGRKQLKNVVGVITGVTPARETCNAEIEAMPADLRFSVNFSDIVWNGGKEQWELPDPTEGKVEEEPSEPITLAELEPEPAAVGGALSTDAY